MNRYSSLLEDLAENRLLRTCEVPSAALINFSSNDYLGLAHDPRLKQVAIQAIEEEGTGASASRLITGTSQRIQDLEVTLAKWHHTEAALVLNSGYQGNIAILQGLLKPGDWVFADRLNHASLVDGCLLSKAKLLRYLHLDLSDLEQKLKEAPESATKWIVSDSVFSMDGDHPDLGALATLAERYNANTLIDEAHAAGLFGDTRAGLCEQQRIAHRITLQVGTFSKALGGFGGYVCGSEVLVQTLVNQARGFIFSTALPPAVIAAAREAVQIVQTDGAPTVKLWQNVRHFREACSDHNLVLPAHESAIIPIEMGETDLALGMSEKLRDAGFLVRAIRPPTVPPGTARLRISLSASHTPTDIERLTETLAQLLPRGSERDS